MSKISIVGIKGLPAGYGGFETLAEQLVQRWTRCDDEFVCFCERSLVSISFEHYNLKRLFLPLRANGVQSLMFDALGILLSIFLRCDVILLLGVSGCWFLPFVKILPRRWRPLIVVNVDGIEWKRAKWGLLTKTILRLLEFLAVRFADKIIADNAAVAEYLSRSYGICSVQIAYGGDHVSVLDSRESLSVPYDGDYFFSVCRIEPENNVHLTLEAFRLVEGQNVLFVGNWQSSEYGRELYNTYGVEPNITLLNPVYDIDILNKFRSFSKGFVHGHSAGGTNPSLVEYMFYGKNILAFDCDFNRVTMEGLGYYFSDIESLVGLLHELLPGYHSESLKMKAYAVDNYMWCKVVSAYQRELC